MALTRKKNCALQMQRLEARECPTAGALDTSFGGTGIVFTDFGDGQNAAYLPTVQPDGKTVVLGFLTQPGPPPKGNKPPQTQNDFALARYNVNGSLDTSFGVGGKVITDFSNLSDDHPLGGVAIQADGKIVAAGTSAGKFAVARYNSNGTLDTTFDTDGKATTSLSGNKGSIGGTRSLVLQSDGKIVLAGSYRSAGPIYSYGFALVRYNANGSLDTSFDGDGIAVSAFTTNAKTTASSLARQNDGRLVVAGEIADVGGVARFNANGSLDISFGGGDGHVELADASKFVDVDMQMDRIVVAGNRIPTASDPVYRPMIARFTAAGVLDTTFGTSGFTVEMGVTIAQSVYGGFNAIETQADDKIVVAGGAWTGQSASYNDVFLAARYSADGVLDTSFSGGIVLTDLSTSPEGETAWDLTIQGDGKIVTAGTGHDGAGNPGFGVVRYLGDDPQPLPPLRTPAPAATANVEFPQPAYHATTFPVEPNVTPTSVATKAGSTMRPTSVLAANATPAANELNAMAADWLALPVLSL